VPLRIEGYEILRELGVGGMGIVYQARDVALGRIVALKMIRGGSLAGGPALNRFRREGLAMGQLDHPHIVPILHHGEHQGQPFYTMRFMAGGSLENCREQIGADVRRAVAFMEKVARAVQYLHEKKILHRDLKPLNILLDESGEPHVTDFGLAKFVESDFDLSQTQPGAILGTWHFMAPEQASGRTDQIGPATDVWALGVILYLLLTGRRPFEGRGRDDLVKLIVKGEPLRPSALRREIDRDLEAIILKCLERTPGRRYPSAGMLADDLHHWLQGEPIVARPDSQSRRLWRAVRRHPVRSMAVTLLVGGLAGLAIGLGAPEIKRLLTPAPVVNPPDTPIVLIDDSGPRTELHWLEGQENAGASSLEPGQPFRVPTTPEHSEALIELLPNVPWKRFRLEAEVKIESDYVERKRATRAGIGFGLVRHPTEKGDYLAFIDLTVSATDSLERARVLNEWMARRPYEPRGLATAGLGPLPNPLVTNAWHQLVVEATPDEMRSFWNDQPVTARASQDLQSSLQGLPMGNPAVKLNYDYQGGIILYVENCTALFRNVVVKPLLDDTGP
jgi:serine/threonine protein kinase